MRTGGAGVGGVSLVLIDLTAKGVTRTPLKKQGWWASDTAALYFDDVEVPADHLIGAENQGFAGIMRNFNGERLGMASGATASARVCIEDAAAWAQQRKTFGKRLADHQVIRHKIAEMVQRVNATTAYLEHCAWRVTQGETPVIQVDKKKDRNKNPNGFFIALFPSVNVSCCNAFLVYPVVAKYSKIERL